MNLVAAITTTSLMVAYKMLCGTVYTKWWLDALDAFFEVKLLLFCTFTLYIRRSSGNQATLSNMFLAVSLLVFSGIVLYHVWRGVTESKLWRHTLKPLCEELLAAKKTNREAPEGGQDDAQCHKQPASSRQQPRASVTFIELREPLLETEDM